MGPLFGLFSPLLFSIRQFLRVSLEHFMGFMDDSPCPLLNLFQLATQLASCLLLLESLRREVLDVTQSQLSNFLGLPL